jgi:CheY-like chemotaxis protein
MPPTGLKMSDDILEHLLLQLKYHAAVRRVARGVSHSYNNIFTGLGGQTAMLQQETHQPAEVSGKRSGLIGELLQRGIEQTAILYGFSRDGDRDCCRQSPLLLANKAIELLNSISRTHRFTFNPHIGQEKIFCNLRDLVLVLFYLGENCVDATPEGGEILLSVYRHEGSEPELAFCFRDPGPGFPEEQVGILSTPTLSTNIASSPRGLGLYAARILAGRYQGKLAFARDRHQQTTLVSAIFPLAPEEKKAKQNNATDFKPRQDGAALAKQCFLVVEDDEAVRTLLLNRLQRRGHMVFCVDTCAEALEEYDHLHDIITTVLMDVGLREGSGFECQRKLLTINPQARIIFMSGMHEMAPREISEKSVFLQKPFTMDQLEKAVQDVHL